MRAKVWLWLVVLMTVLVVGCGPTKHSSTDTEPPPAKPMLKPLSPEVTVTGAKEVNHSGLLGWPKVLQRLGLNIESVTSIPVRND